MSRRRTPQTYLSPQYHREFWGKLRSSYRRRCITETNTCKLSPESLVGQNYWGSGVSHSSELNVPIQDLSAYPPTPAGLGTRETPVPFPLCNRSDQRHPKHSDDGRTNWTPSVSSHSSLSFTNSSHWIDFRLVWSDPTQTSAPTFNDALRSTL